MFVTGQLSRSSAAVTSLLSVRSGRTSSKMASGLLSHLTHLPNVVQLEHAESKTKVFVVGTKFEHFFEASCCFSLFQLSRSKLYTGTLMGVGYLSPQLERMSLQQISTLMLAAQPQSVLVEACPERIPDFNDYLKVCSIS